MRIISEKALWDFGKTHSDAMDADAMDALMNWKRIVRNSDWESGADVKKTFSNSYMASGWTFFTIALNRYGLIAFISFRTRIVYVKAIRTRERIPQGRSTFMSARASILSSAGLDPAGYGRLLVRVMPKLIETESENEAALAIVEALMKKGDDGRTPEEDALLGLLAHLVEQFEQKHYQIPDGDPVGALKLLMESNGLKAIDLAGVFGGRSRVSEILAGKRSISKEQAKRLGEYFLVSPAVFI